jgi:beta-glucosidase
MTKKFLDGFLWGAATSSFQVEGGIENNDWAEAAREGKVPPVGIAADHYHRYEEDFDIAKSLNHNAHRFSIEWARIEPEEGKFDEKEIEHYKKVVSALKARGLEPFVTLWHFSLPVWFLKSGNFKRKDAPAIFARYAGRVAEALGADARFFITMNEPLVWLGEQGEAVGAIPLPQQDPLTYLYVWDQLVRAHKAAYTTIRGVTPAAQVGIAKHSFSFKGTNPVGNIVAVAARWFWNRRFLGMIRHHQDFIGIQYYQRLFFWNKPNVPTSDIGWQIIPEGIYDPLMEAARYGVPIYITENGIADSKDQYRESFIKKSLEAVHHAIADGANIRGYLHWSLLDNYEFKKAYSMQFGLVHIDRNYDLARVIRPSARAYAEICKANAI